MLLARVLRGQKKNVAQTLTSEIISMDLFSFNCFINFLVCNLTLSYAFCQSSKGSEKKCGANFDLRDDDDSSLITDEKERSSSIS